MILVIPIIFLKNGKSKYSIGGLPEFEKLENYFKNNPIKLAKLFREENNKSILFSIDNSDKSIEIVKETIESLDIPIQVLSRESLNTSNKATLESLTLGRIFDLLNNNSIMSTNYIPLIKKSELIKINNINHDRVLIDFEGQNISPLSLTKKIKISAINARCTTKDLVLLNKNKSNIDSVYLGKEYYEVHFAGQKLWRIAEKAQFGI